MVASLVAYYRQVRVGHMLRKVTERPEVVALGAAKLVGTDPEKICAEAARLLKDERVYQVMASVENPFGNGRASEKIVQALRDAWPQLSKV